MIHQAYNSTHRMLYTVEQMASRSGIGENTLRKLLDQGQIEYVRVGNRRLLAESAIEKWYEENKVRTVTRGM